MLSGNQVMGQPGNQATVSGEEMKLIWRLRQLQAGAHLVIIHKDNSGLFGLTVLESGKLERLRKSDMGAD